MMGDRGRGTRFSDSQQLFVGNLPHNVSEKELRQFFGGKYSNVSEKELRQFFGGKYSKIPRFSDTHFTVNTLKFKLKVLLKCNTSE